MKLPTISSYYPYSSNNYGANALKVEFDTLTLFYSYKTVVAFSTPDTGLVARVNDWSTTTGKHLNEICPDKKERISGEMFETELQKTLVRLGLTTS